ncbi:universal stress protein [Thermoleptolyngbya sichuanensis A183]|uniref:Universal stress protein n=1 Tax=Thermoleptolyngbya sichuanensis A183 TaxID=2737172 RepID=A0A6M8BH20_9CYAN|nr:MULTISPECIES: cation:proton antiporter [Thermoleptolyngbya]QKD83490.1 universal stress protein [Thermoleptolyngbya sichuanensis A183]
MMLTRLHIQGLPVVLQPALVAFIFRPITDPVAVFLVIIAIMLVSPLVFERIRLPGIVGLILAGLIVGPYGLNILERDSTIVLLGTVGLLFLMFMAGLETSLDDLKTNARGAISFGLATFLIPMLMGTVAMLLLGYSFLAAILVASCFASHTLLSLPIASKLGIMRTQTVTITLGGTLITNVLALLVLAVVVKAHQGDLTLSFWLFLIPSLAIYTFATLWGVPRIGRWFFQRFGHDEGAEFTFVVAALFLVSYVARLIEIEPIIGAFLAGVAIAPLIPQFSPLMNRIQFIGNSLFVPFFLISVGMLVNPLILLQEPKSIAVAAVMVGVAIVAKYLPAWMTSKWFRLSTPSMMVMFGLSVAQAASTLAAITVAYNIELVDQPTVNGTIMMILVTCIASPWITSRWGDRIPLASDTATEPASTLVADSQKELKTVPLRVLVPVANPDTEANLLQLALILVCSTEGTLLPLHVLPDSQDWLTAADRSQQAMLLGAAETLANAAAAEVEPIGRIDDSIDRGILRTAQEREANLIVCGWKGFSTYRDHLFGSVIDNVVRRAGIPVLVTRLMQPMNTVKRVLLVVTAEDFASPQFADALALVKGLATGLKATFVLGLAMSDEAIATNQLDSLKSELKDSVYPLHGDIVRSLSYILDPNDLLILLHETRSYAPYAFGQPTLGVTPEAIARQYRAVSMAIVNLPSS